MRYRDRNVRLCILQDLIYMAADRARDRGDYETRDHFMQRYERIKNGARA